MLLCGRVVYINVTIILKNISVIALTKVKIEMKKKTSTEKAWSYKESPVI